MNKLTKVLDIVREKNPETMKLTRGCIFRYHDTDFIISSNIGFYWEGEEGYSEPGMVEFSKDIGDVPTLEEQGIEYKILGHPLYPSHLLVALGNDHIALSCKGNLCLDEFCEDERIVDIFRTYEEEHQDNMIIEPTAPLEPQLQANPELVETLFKLLSK